MPRAVQDEDDEAEDEEEDDEDMSSDEAELAAALGARRPRKKPSVVIEDITDQEVREGGRGRGGEVGGVEVGRWWQQAGGGARGGEVGAVVGAGRR